MIRTEIKKILTGRKTVLLVLMTFLYAVLFLLPYFGQNNGSYRIEADVASTFRALCGDSMEPEEYEKMRQKIPYQEKKELNEVVKNSEAFRKEGITNLGDFIAVSATQEKKEQLWEVLSREISSIEKTEGEMTVLFEDMIELNCWAVFLDAYALETLDDGTQYYQAVNGSQEQRIQERNRQEVRTFVPFRLIDNNLELLQFFAPLTWLSMILLIVPYMIRENRSGVIPLQYSSRYGRRYFWNRLLAVLFSCTVITAADLALYMFLAWQNRTFEFWGLPASSCISAFIGWFDWSVGELILTALFLIALTAIGTGFLVFAVTCGCSGYIQGIALQLPVLGVGIAFGILGMRHFTEITQNKWAVFAAAAFWLLLGSAAAILRGHAEKRRNI